MTKVSSSLSGKEQERDKKCYIELSEGESDSEYMDAESDEDSLETRSDSSVETHYVNQNITSKGRIVKVPNRLDL